MEEGKREIMSLPAPKKSKKEVTGLVERHYDPLSFLLQPPKYKTQEILGGCKESKVSTVRGG